MKEKILKVINEKNKKTHKEKKKNITISRGSLSFNLFGNFLPLILLFIFADHFKKKSFFNFLFVLFLFLAFFSTYVGLKKIINNSKRKND